MVAPLYRGFSSVASQGLAAVRLVDGEAETVPGASNANSIDTRLFDVELVKQDLLNHFGTRIGERVGRPSFGSIIHDLLFDVFDERTEGLVLADANRIFAEDPRVIPLRVGAVVDPDTHKIQLVATLQLVEFNMETNFIAEFEARG